MKQKELPFLCVCQLCSDTHITHAVPRAMIVADYKIQILFFRVEF